MFKFITSNDKTKNVSEEYIKNVERKFNIKFPTVLKEYYLNYNFSDNKECCFKIDGFDGEDTDFILDCIIPLKYGTIPFEKQYEYVLNDNDISSDFIPLAVDLDSDLYYWNKKSGEVWYISHENVENPIPICESVEKFFEILNDSCDKKIIIPDFKNIFANQRKQIKTPNINIKDIITIILCLLPIIFAIIYYLVN